jgi:hypothetical protein
MLFVAFKGFHFIKEVTHGLLFNAQRHSPEFTVFCSSEVLSLKQSKNEVVRLW